MEQNIYICPSGTANVVFSMRGFGCFQISAKSVVANRVRRGLDANLQARDKIKLARRPEAYKWTVVLQFFNDILAKTKNQYLLVSYMQGIHPHGAIVTSWAYKTILILMHRLPEKNVLVGLDIYEYIVLGPWSRSKTKALREMSDVAMKILAELQRT